MTPEDPESRRIANELKRRERQGPGTGASVDPATLQAILEQHAGTVATLVGQIETSLSAKIDTLANAQGTVAENLRREIERGRKGGDADKAAALERQFRDEQRTALEGLSTGMKQEFAALKASLDTREGGIFAGIDNVAERVRPAARALTEMRQAVVGSTAAARDVASIREAVVDNRRAIAEVATIRETVTRSGNAIDDLMEMRPILVRIETRLGKEVRGVRRRRWLGWIRFVVLAIVLGAGGVALQRETAIWPPLTEAGNRDRNLFWERYGEQLAACRDEARKLDLPMACTIVVMDP